MLMLPLIAAVIVSAAAIAYVVWPLLQPSAAPVIVEDDRLTALIARKDATLVAIKDLEFDYNTGKLSDEDFERMNDRLRRQAIGYIKQIDKVAPENMQLDERIEAEIAALRTTLSVAPFEQQPAPPIRQPDVTAEVIGVAQFCTNCGHPLKPEHKFCANCGAPLAEA